MTFTKQKVKQFRGDFAKAVSQLEKDFGCSIDLGTIRFDANEFRVKLTAKQGERVAKLTSNDFLVGDTVKINHKKVSFSELFIIHKINKKSIKVRNTITGREWKVSPNLLVKA
jgi:hypothetical protein